MGLSSAALAGLAALALAAGAGEAIAQTEVDLQLVIAADVSRSMDVAELKVQRRGYVEAFRHPDVIEAIRSGANGRIAVTYLEFAGQAWQSPILPWRLIDGTARAQAFAEELSLAPGGHWGGTSLSTALNSAARLFDQSRFKAERRVIDISGDGPNNDGPPVLAVRDAVLRRGIVINGLPIMIHPNEDTRFDIADLDLYYESCVIGGPGAFIVSVHAIEELAEAIRRKLVLEIASVSVPPIIRVATASTVSGIDCLIGEKMRE